MWYIKHNEIWIIKFKKWVEFKILWMFRSVKPLLKCIKNMIIHSFLFILIIYFLLVQVLLKVFEFLHNAQILIKFDSSHFNLWIFYRTWDNKKYLIKLNKKLCIIIFLINFYQRLRFPKKFKEFWSLPIFKIL